MAGVDDKIAATSFTVPTTLSFEEVQAAAETAAKQADGIADRFVRAGTDGQRISYQLKRAKLNSIADCTVRYAAGENGNGATVTFTPGSYVRSRPKMFIFIPTGPWQSAALKPFTRFSSALRTKVSA